MIRVINFFAIVAFFFLASLSTSCYTQRKAQKEIIKADVTYPTVVSGYCGKKYPPKTSKGVPITTIIQGETVTDTLIVTDTVTNVITKYLTKYRTDTFRVNTTDTVENTAKISELQAIVDEMSVELSEANVKIAVLKQGKSNWMWIAISLMAVIASWFGIKYVIPIALKKG